MRSVLKLQKNLIDVALALNIFGFATALAGVFIPLVILKSGGSLWEVPAFYLSYALCKLALNYPVVLLIQKRGAHFGLGVSFVAGGLQMLAILGFAATHQNWLLAAGAASLSLTNAFLWNAQHLFISKAMSNGTKSSSIATIAIIGQFTSALAPLIGGLIGTFLGAKTLLILSVLLCLAALIPVRRMEHFAAESDAVKITYNFRGAPARDVLANFFYNIETAVGVMVWPIYLALFVATYSGVGTITALASLVAIAVTWLAGHRGDKGHDRAVLREGVAITSALDVIRIFVTSQFWITVVSSGYKTSLAYIQNAWTSVYYYHAK